MWARTRSCTRSVVCTMWQEICGRAIAPVRNEKGTIGSSPRCSTKREKSMLRR